MKLFKSLLVTQAVLGLIAPVTASASEINLDELNNYARKKSSSKKRFNSKTFTNQEFAKTNTSNKSIKALINPFEAGTFSETTTMNGSEKEPASNGLISAFILLLEVFVFANSWLVKVLLLNLFLKDDFFRA